MDLCEGVFEGGVAVAFAGDGGVEGLFLRGECGGEAELIVVSGEPGVEDERGEEECGAGGGDFDCAAGGESERHEEMEAGSLRSGSSLLVVCSSAGLVRAFWLAFACGSGKKKLCRVVRQDLRSKRGVALRCDAADAVVSFRRGGAGCAHERRILRGVGLEDFDVIYEKRFAAGPGVPSAYRRRTRSEGREACGGERSAVNS